MSHEVSLEIAGKKHLGFKTGMLTRSMEQAADTFDVTYSDRWLANSEPFPIEAGDTAKILFDGIPALTGFVDGTEVSYSAKSSDLQARGRSKTGDLIDCSAVFKAGQWRKKTLRSICEDLLAPFNVGLIIDGDEGPPFKRFAVENGETVFEAVARMCKLRSKIPMSDANGNLVLAQAGLFKTKTVLRDGVNIKTGRRSDDWRDRFSDYLLRGQVKGDDDTFGRAAAWASSRCVDAHLAERLRFRPLVVLSGGQDGKKDLDRRARLECNRRAGRGERLSYTVSGWQNAEGLFWEPNTMITVKDERLRVNADLLISSVTYRFGLSDDGFSTDLVLVRRETFDFLRDYPRRLRGKAWV